MISSEFDIIRRYFSQQQLSRADVNLGIGDDAALLQPPADQLLVVTTDTLASGVHFPEQTDAESIGYKVLAVSLSDLAAMGAEPAWFTLTISLPQADEIWLTDFSRGLFSLAQEHNIQLVGGDTTHGPLSITVQAMGFVPQQQALIRSGAKAGNGIYVTGTLGDAGAGLQLIKKELSAEEKVSGELQERLNRPTPRITAGLALRGLASAAIDISDGLSADLGHILEASHVGADVKIDDLPLSTAFRSLSLENDWQLAVSAGDDYELCFTVPEEQEQSVQQKLDAIGCPWIRIGMISSQAGLRWLDKKGNEMLLASAGYDHFAQSGSDQS
jgi:thiamine-monophosphate kinase